MAAQLPSVLAECRHAAGCTQETFAGKLGVDRTTVGWWERGVQSPQPWQRRDLAAALGVSLEQLDELLRRTSGFSNAPATIERAVCEPVRAFVDAERGGPGSVDGFFGDDAVHAVIPELRRVLDCLDVPDDGPTRPLIELAVDVAGMIEHRLHSIQAPTMRALRCPFYITTDMAILLLRVPLKRRKIVYQWRAW